MKNLTVIAIMLLALPALAVDSVDVIGPRLERAMATPDGGPRHDDGTWGVWIYFTDKGLTGTGLDEALAATKHELSERTLARRARVTPADLPLVDQRDLSVAGHYLASITELGARPRRQSRWLNAASFDATARQIEAIARLPYVNKVELVAQFVRPELEVTPVEQAEAARRLEAAKATDDRETLSYGGSTPALEQINVPPLHEMGLTGQGVVIAQLDAGFVLSHVSLQHIPVLAQWDFVHDDDNVQFQEGDHDWQHQHGSQVLSVLMGRRDGELVGPAYGASVILAMTEDIGDETPVEEDNWVAALEWVEGLGADLVISSLGYYYWYEFSDLDGDTAVTSVAADMAVARGLSVFTSAGNEAQNPEWPHLTAPADGDSVVAVGAVDVGGDLAGFSSQGPTYDGRIKPDVCALGVSSHVAAYYDDESYMPVNGTSYAAPLVAGVAALMLERLPTLTPMQIREALRETADSASIPNNAFGWGVIDAAAAVAYWGPTISHTPLVDTENISTAYEVTASITSRTPLDESSPYLTWRVDGQAWQRVAMSSSGPDTYTAFIPTQSQGGLVEYYLEAADQQSFFILAPHSAPATTWSFTVGIDETLPSLVHHGLIDQTPGTWPPLLWATATDNQAVAQVTLEFAVNGGANQGPYPLTADGDVYELDFPLDPAVVASGDVVTYSLTAHDSAASPNSVTSGPHEIRILESLGNVLIIDDSVRATAAGEESPAQDLAVPAAGTERGIAPNMELWLTNAGYEIESVMPGAVDGALLQGRDAVVLTCGINLYPLNNAQMRSHLIAYVSAGGRILVEGGELAAMCFDLNDFPVFAATVLHAASWWGDGVGPMMAPLDMVEHSLLNRPHRLPDTIEQTLSNPNNFANGDLVPPTVDAQIVMQSIYNSNAGGILVHDDNTGVEAGQVVYVTYDLNQIEADTARLVVENSLAYLLGREAPGEASISGTVAVIDAPDASGVTVSCGAEHSVVTGADGTYTISGLHGSTYTVTAALTGYGTGTRTVELGAVEAASGIDFTLSPIVAANYDAAPEQTIPDYNTGGITSVITVVETGDLHSMDVDIDIEHGSIGNLTVTLSSPSGTTVTLHNKSGELSDDLVGNWPGDLLVDGPGSLADFNGEPVQGDWTLRVSDTVFGAIGTLHTWGLNLLIGQPVSAIPVGRPLVTGLVGNVPNPFNPRTVIVFELRDSGPVELNIYDVRGQRVRRLVQQEMAPGRHEVVWDGRDTAGRAAASGLYFCRLQTRDRQSLHKMTLVR